MSVKISKMKKSIILLNSYEAVKYVVNFINQKDEQTEIIISVYANEDLYKHVKKIFNNSELIKIYFIKKFSNLKILLGKFFPSIIKKNHFNFISKDVEEFYYTTRICANHALPILKLMNKSKIKCFYIPLSHKKTYFDNADGSFSGFNRFTVNNFNDFLYYLFYWIFFNKDIDLFRVGVNRVITLSKKFTIKYSVYKINFFRKENNLKYFDDYMKLNYVNITGNKKLIFYDQYYHLRNLVHKSEYKKLIKDLFYLFDELGYQSYFKGHPGISLNKLEFVPRFVTILESYIPSEFLTEKNFIPISITSGSIVNKPDSKYSISLVHLIPYLNNNIYKECLNAIRSKMTSKVLFPKKQSQLIENIRMITKTIN